MVGRVVVRTLLDASFDVVGLDIIEGDDVVDPRTVAERIRGCRFVVHLAALDEEPEERGELDPPSTGGIEQILRTNVGGTALLLGKAAEEGVERVVFLSSADVLGCFIGQGRPAYLPIDDHHPLDPQGPYAWSKLVGEELVATFTTVTGAASVCLRAPGVFDTSTYDFIRASRSDNPESEWAPFWEYGAFIDVRDLASAVTAALTVPGLSGHHRLLVNADDLSSAAEDAPTLVERLLPDVPLHSSIRLEQDRFAALLETGLARAVLQWEPEHRWRP